MSDFVQTMKDWKRMCDWCTLHPVDDYCGAHCKTGCGFNKPFAALKMAANNPEKFEKLVMAWVAEHPDPVYPTWYEYLFNVTRGENKWPVDDHEFCRWLDTTPIPADLAQKLGIEPKEV